MTPAVYLHLAAETPDVAGCDAVETIARMLSRRAERLGWTTRLVHAREGSVAGLRAVTLRIAGDGCDVLRAEHGRHEVTAGDCYARLAAPPPQPVTRIVAVEAWPLAPALDGVTFTRRRGSAVVLSVRDEVTATHARRSATVERSGSWAASEALAAELLAAMAAGVPATASVRAYDATTDEGRRVLDGGVILWLQEACENNLCR